MIMVIKELHLRKSIIVISKLENNDMKNIKDIITKNSIHDISFKESEISDTINNIEHDIENTNEIELDKIKDTSKDKETMKDMTEEIKSINNIYYEDPAYKTITNNLQEKNRINDTQLFVTDDDLMKAQTNKLAQGLISNEEVKLCSIQGYTHLTDSGSKL